MKIDYLSEIINIKDSKRSSNLEDKSTNFSS